MIAGLLPRLGISLVVSLALANTAASPAGIVVRVLRALQVPSGAVCFPGRPQPLLVSGISHVVGARTQEQMRRIHAAPNRARMADVHFRRRFSAIRKFPRHAVSLNRSAGFAWPAKGKCAVVLRADGCRPDPALCRAILVDFGPESRRYIHEHILTNSPPLIHGPWSIV
jgi:hypothetical protein